MVKLFLAGDVMVGRGVDQVQHQSVDPVLYEEHIRDARHYVALAERVNGSIPRPVTPDYVWGDALRAIDETGVDCRIVNLETTLTTSPAAWPAKEVLYRAHPTNVGVLQAARVDCCALANNHALDWGTDGLLETLETLQTAGIPVAGAGRSADEAEQPVLIDRAGARVIVVAFATTTSGTPPDWASGPDRPGLLVVDDWSTAVCERIADRVSAVRRPGDVVVASVHWGSNWGYAISGGQRRLAHALVDLAGVDVIFGHSSHHARPIEFYRDRPILYGTGDFITDYEGIGGYEEFRNDLVLGWFIEVDEASGRLVGLRAAPFQSRRFRLERPSRADVAWLAEVLDHHSRVFGVRVSVDDEGMLVAGW